MTAALTGYATAKRDLYLSLKQGAQSSLNAASTALAADAASAQALVKTGADLDKEIARLRQQMSAPGKSPAAIDDLNGLLALRLIDKRHLAAQMIIAKERVQRAEALCALYNNQLVELGKTHLLAETGLQDAQARELRHNAWSSTTTEDEISPLRTAATELLAGTFTPDPEDPVNPAQLLADARARVEGDIPQVLRDRARARAVLVADRLEDFRTFLITVTDTALTQAQDNGGSRGTLARRWTGFISAENALRDYALTTAGRYHQAVALLQGIVQSPQLSAAELAAITAASLPADADALVTEAELHEQRVAILAKELELEAARFAARAADVDADPEADADVIDRRDELAQLEADLGAITAAHTAEFAAALDTWEAAVPDLIWANLQAFDQALALLDTVANSDRAPLLTALADSETALIEALETDDSATRLAAYLAAMRDLADSQYDYLVDADSATRRSALRGDF